MQSETWIEKAGFRSEIKIGFLVRLKKRLFNPRLFDYDFQLDKTVEKTEIVSPTHQLDACIGKVKKSRRIVLVRVSHTHTTLHTTQPHTATSATLAWQLPLLQLLVAKSA